MKPGIEKRKGSLKKKITFIYLGVGTYMEVRAQLAWVGSVLLPHEYWGSNSGHQALWQSPSLAEPSHHLLAEIS